MCLTSPGSLGENVEGYLLAEENLAVSKVFFHETVMFRDLAPRRTRPPADPPPRRTRPPGRPAPPAEPSPGRSRRLPAINPHSPPEPAAGRSRRPALKTGP